MAAERQKKTATKQRPLPNKNKNANLNEVSSDKPRGPSRVTSQPSLGIAELSNPSIASAKSRLINASLFALKR
jgi:hypothetical protein